MSEPVQITNDTWRGIHQDAEEAKRIVDERFEASENTPTEHSEESRQCAAHVDE